MKKLRWWRRTIAGSVHLTVSRLAADVLSLVPGMWLTIQRLAPHEDRFPAPATGDRKWLLVAATTRPSGTGGWSGAEDASPYPPCFVRCPARGRPPRTLWLQGGRFLYRARLAKPPGADVHIRESTMCQLGMGWLPRAESRRKRWSNQDYAAMHRFTKGEFELIKSRPEMAGIPEVGPDGRSGALGFIGFLRHRLRRCSCIVVEFNTKFFYTALSISFDRSHSQGIHFRGRCIWRNMHAEGAYRGATWANT